MHLRNFYAVEEKTPLFSRVIGSPCRHGLSAVPAHRVPAKPAGLTQVDGGLCCVFLVNNKFTPAFSGCDSSDFPTEDQMGSIREMPRKNGEVSYHAEIRLLGMKPQRATFRTRTQAKQWIQKTEADVRANRFFKPNMARKVTLADCIDRFVAEVVSRGDKTYYQHLGRLAWWKEHVGHLILLDITREHLLAARDQLAADDLGTGRHRSPATVNRYLALLSAVFRAAVRDWQWLDENPLRWVAKLKEPKGRTRYLSPTEIPALLAACRASDHARLETIVRFALHTGMRFGEIASLEWRDVDEVARIVRIRRTKNGDTRCVPLSSHLKELLAVCRSSATVAESKVFLMEGARCSGGGSIRRAFEKACKQAGIADFRFHDLRHTAASYMAMGGASQGELMAVLGHRSPLMTQRYAHFSQEHLRQLLERTGPLFQPGPQL
jgi:integrase